MLEVLFCLIVGVTDDDMLKARCGDPGSYEEIKVRLIAIDAPEKRQDFGNRSIPNPTPSWEFRRNR